jgi:UDP-N-acetylmuramoyl-tripeptide--D-alanyl-D-alanine ligase
MEAMLVMFEKLSGSHKWVVVGDMLELGEKEREEHERLGEILAGMELERVILVGKRVGDYTYSKLIQNYNSKVKSENVPVVERFLALGEVLRYLEKNLRGGEVVLLKGSQSVFLEAVIEGLLEDKKDVEGLPRRGEFWEEKRQKALA